MRGRSPDLIQINNTSFKIKQPETPPKKLIKDEKESAKTERVNVYIRLRPFTYQENEAQRVSCIESFDQTGKTITSKKLCLS